MFGYATLRLGLPVGWIVAAWCLITASTAIAQDGLDVVEMRRSRDSIETFERKGQILSCRGSELQLQSQNTLRKIDTDDVVRIRTLWPDSYNEARRLIQERRFSESVEALQLALEDESRPWAAAMIRAELVRILDLTGQQHAAAIEFLKILADDPASRHYPTIPLAWNSTIVSAAMQAEADKWMRTSIPAVRLLGASWLLGTSQRAEAIKTLELLSRDIEARIAHLASAQLWRSTWITTDQPTLERWKEQIDRMPESIRSGPLLILAAGQEKNGMIDEAVINLMRVPILHAEDLPRTRLALDQAAQILLKHDRKPESDRIRVEYNATFPGLESLSEIHRN